MTIWGPGKAASSLPTPPSPYTSKRFQRLMPARGDVWSIAVQATWNNAAMESYFCSPKIE